MRPIGFIEKHHAKSWDIMADIIHQSYRIFDLGGRELLGDQMEPRGYGHIVICPSEKIGVLG
jgi:hypothetical protein